MDTQPTNPETTLPWWKHYSTWVVFVAEMLYALPIDWANQDFTTWDREKTLHVLALSFMYVLAKLVKQTPLTKDQP